jgi:hypothetical protein
VVDQRQTEKQTEMSFTRNRFVTEVKIQIARISLCLVMAHTCTDIQISKRTNEEILQEFFLINFFRWIHCLFFSNTRKTSKQVFRYNIDKDKRCDCICLIQG